MTTETQASEPRALQQRPPSRRTFQDIVDLLGRTPYRLRERRFWQVQALVLLATAPHYAIEASGAITTFEDWQLNSLAISIYILPLLYAALNYSWEGAVLTAVWAATLTSPSIWLWEREPSHWVTEIGQLVVVLPIGLLVAWRVDLETKQRQRAEKTSASLSLLNEIGDELSHTMEAEAQIPEILRKLLSGLPLKVAWVYLEPEHDSDPPTLILEALSGQTILSNPQAHTLHSRAKDTQEPFVESDNVVIPLLSEDGPLGSLGAVLQARELTEEHMEVLTTVAGQLSAAIVNARLYHEKQESMQSYVRHVTEAQEEERLRIARELHDETAQELISMSRKLEQLKDRVGTDQIEEIEGLLGMTRGTIQAVRRYSRDLRPSILDDLGLHAAIEMVVEDTGQQLPTGASLKVSGQERRLDGPLELALFRIAQEALRNVVKHADASSATVELSFAEDAVTLAVTDDGSGFMPAGSISGLIQKGKLGVVGMKERAELVGGTLELWPPAKGGTRVEVRVRTAPA